MIQLNPNEKIIFIARVHWLAIFLDALRAAILAGIPFLIALYITNFSNSYLDESSLRYLWGSAIAFAVVIWNFFFISWTDRVLDTWVITTERVIDIEQRGLFSRNIAVMRLDDIQDLVIDTRGFLATILRYGDINIQSSGTTREFDFKMVDDPEYVKNVIEKAIVAVGGSRWHR